MIRKRGFTLIELVVAMAIFIIIATAISIAVSRLYAIRTFYEQQLDLQQNFVYAMDRLSEDFRQAEYSGTDIFVSPPESNAMIDATESTPLSFYGPGGQVVSYYLKRRATFRQSTGRKVLLLHSQLLKTCTSLLSFTS